MDKDYTKYTADQLLNDDFFLKSESSPTAESLLFWQKQMAENKSLAAEIEVARLFLNAIRTNVNKTALPNSESEALWQCIEQKNNSTDRKSRQRYLLLSVIGIAASICILLSLGKYITLQSDKQETNYLSIIEAIPQSDSTSSKVQLILSNNEKMTIDGEDSQLEYKQEGSININSQKIEQIKKEKQKTTFNQLIVPVGKRSTVTFSDGTKIWVNSDSKVIYPVVFSEKEREIFVEGEIYLEVSKDEKKPFIVKTRQMDIKVLGTQFNVTAYDNEKDMQVVLVSGKVEIKSGNKHKDILSPNEMFRYDKEINQGTVSRVDIDDYVAWKDGYYQFKQQSLEVILKKLSRYYGVLLYCGEDINEVSCSGKLDLKEDLEDVLSSLKKAIPIEIEKKNESIEIKVKH
ncbi:FecR family protein [Parabacteroides faecis]|uniref:DUF4974 domain-containing protein n=1 Tax=Parabacteroides faecis TaxID=1217282 RepID=A0ABR6KG46_9BACT|nr:FecR domain-containing protein [Parabacteroides faecis]MBB4620480.1 hypothetical protein [Parabacteroides faecis]GGK05135.1 iron dicitrate transporter FecR [Parabacteroides faecis]